MSPAFLVFLLVSYFFGALNSEVKTPSVQYITNTTGERANISLPQNPIVNFNNNNQKLASIFPYRTVILKDANQNKNDSNAGNQSVTVTKAVPPAAIHSPSQMASSRNKGPGQNLSPANPNSPSIYPSIVDESPHIEETITYQVKRQHQKRLNYDGKGLLLEKPAWLEFLLRPGENQQTSPPPPEENKSFNDEKMEITRKKVEELESKVNAILESFTLLQNQFSDAPKNASSPAATNASTNGNSQVFTASVALHNNLSKEIRSSASALEQKMLNKVNMLHAQMYNASFSSAGLLKNLSAKINKGEAQIAQLADNLHRNELRLDTNGNSLLHLEREVYMNQEKVDEMASSVGPRWAEQTTGCGGVLVADAGIISYKFRQQYTNNERCIWTVRVNRKNKVTLRLLEDGFQNASNTDYLSVTEFHEDESLAPVLVTSTRLEHKNRASHTFRGPVLFIKFFSDANFTGNGFKLKFQGGGNSSLFDHVDATRYEHHYFEEATGLSRFPFTDDSTYHPNSFVTIVINPKSTFAPLKVSLTYCNLEKEERCEYDSASFYHSRMGSYALAKKYCENDKRLADETLRSEDGDFIIVFRSDASTQFSGFRFGWETL